MELGPAMARSKLGSQGLSWLRIGWEGRVLGMARIVPAFSSPGAVGLNCHFCSGVSHMALLPGQRTAGHSNPGRPRALLVSWGKGKDKTFKMWRDIDVP